MIRPDIELLADRAPDPLERTPASLRRPLRTKRTSTKALETQAPQPAAPIPAWARATGRAGEDSLFAAGAGLALLDLHLRRDLASAGALRQRLALISAGTCAKLLRINTHEGALRDLRFALGDAGPAARLLHLWRDLAARPPSLEPGRLAAAAAALELAAPNADALAETLRERSRAGDPVSAASRSAAFVFSAFPDAAAAEAEILALWAFDLVLAIRLRWARSVPLIGVKILGPGIRSGGGGRPRPGDPAWESIAAGAIALAAASALDLAADLARRADALVAVAPKLRAKPAPKIVDLLLAQDCVAPAEAARHAPMTDRAARRLFDRLLALGAVREFSGRPAFRLYGL
jgi:Protein of unknown function (DUF1403)